LHAETQAAELPTKKPTQAVPLRGSISVNVHRIARPIIAEMLKRCLLPDREIIEAADWMAGLTMRYGACARLRSDAPAGRAGRASRWAGEWKGGRVEKAASERPN
jgi:hypothetical protein